MKRGGGETSEDKTITRGREEGRGNSTMSNNRSEEEAEERRERGEGGEGGGGRGERGEGRKRCSQRDTRVRL